MARGQAKVNICSFKGFQRLQWAMKLLHAGREAAADEKPKEQVPQAARERRTSLCTAKLRTRKRRETRKSTGSREQGPWTSWVNFSSLTANRVSVDQKLRIVQVRVKTGCVLCFRDFPFAQQDWNLMCLYFSIIYQLKYSYWLAQWFSC